MYNRYIPEDAAYTWVGEKRGAAAPPPRPSQQHSGQSAGRGGLGALFSGNGGLGALLNGREGLGALLSSGREGEGVLTGALKSLGLEGIDAGDILLLLIILLLLAEGDDLELVIALGLVLLMGLTDGKKEQEERQDSEG